MSAADRNFVKSLSVSYADVAGVLGVSRQAVSRGVHKDADDYFSTADLSTILADFEKTDPVRFEIAKRSVADLYPTTAKQISQLIDAHEGAAFDVTIPGDYSLVVGDFVGLMGRMAKCREQIEILTSRLQTTPGSFNLIVTANDRVRAEKFRDDQLDSEDGQRMPITVCLIDLTLFPTCLMRITFDYKVDIFIASDDGFIPLNSFESERIKQRILKIQSDVM